MVPEIRTHANRLACGVGRKSEKESGSESESERESERKSGSGSERQVCGGKRKVETSVR